jgi:hypothetical protein
MPPPPGAEFAPPGWEPDQALLGAIEKDDPEFWKDISRFRTSEPERFRDEVFRWKNRRDRLARLRTEDPEKARMVERIDALERQSRKLADQIRSAPESERGPLRESLVGVLSELFDRREEDRRAGSRGRRRSATEGRIRMPRPQDRSTETHDHS